MLNLVPLSVMTTPDSVYYPKAIELLEYIHIVLLNLIFLG